MLAAALIAAGAYFLRTDSATSAATHHRRVFLPPGMCDIQPENIGNITSWSGGTMCTISSRVPASVRRAWYAAAIEHQKRQWETKGYTGLRCTVKPHEYVCSAASNDGNRVVFAVGQDPRP